MDITTFSDTAFGRSGAAFGGGTPFGASINIGQVTSTARQAAGAAGALTGSPLTDPNAWQDKTAGSMVTGVVNAGIGVLGWLGKPLEMVGNYIEASGRYIRNSDATNPFNATLSAFGAPIWWDPKWREEWNRSYDAKSSPGQTWWLAAKSIVDADGTAPKDAPFALLDDPNRIAERDEYFGGGLARWTSGVIDFGVNMALDPLVVAGAVSKGALAGARTIRASDVAAASRASLSGAPEAANLTRGGRKIAAQVSRTADALVEATKRPGGLAEIARSKFMVQSGDGGAIPYMASRLAASQGDDTLRESVERMLYAGMGDRESLRWLEQQDELLAIELRSLQGPNKDLIVHEILNSNEYDHIAALRAANADGDVDRVVELVRDDILARRQGFERVHAIGSPADLRGDALAATEGLGTISQIPIREQMKVVGTIQRGLGLPPVHVLWGQKLPGHFSLTDPDAYDSFASAVMRTAGRTQAKSRVDDTMRGFLDEFATSYGMFDEGAARATRREIIDRFNREATERLVAKYQGQGGKTAQEIRAAIEKIRQRRTDQMAYIWERAQGARDDLMHVKDGSSGAVLAFDPAFTRPFASTMLEDLVTIPDYLGIERMLKHEFRYGFHGYLASAKLGGADTLASKTIDFGDEFLTATTQLWTFAQLARPGYAIRNMVDSQSRNLAMIGAMETAQNTLDGTRNLFYNLSKTSQDELDRIQGLISAKAQLRQIDDYLASAPDMVKAETLAEHSRLEGLVSTLEFGGHGPRVLYLDEKIAQVREEISQLAEKRALVRIGGATRGEGRADYLLEKRLRVQLAELKAGRDQLINTRTRRSGTVAERHLGMEGNKFQTGRKAAFRDIYDYRRSQAATSFHDTLTQLMQQEYSRWLPEIRTGGQWQHITPTNSGWTNAYLDLVNKRVRNSPELMMIVGGADDAALRAYYLENPAGNKVWKSISDRFDSVDELIDWQRSQVDLLLPTEQAKGMLQGAPLTEGQLDAIFGGDVIKPAVGAEMLEAAPRNAAQGLVNRYLNTRDWWFKHFGEIPEESLSRHPFYVSRKRGHLDQLWPVDKAGNPVNLTVKQSNELYVKAGQLARRDVATYLFETSKRSNLSSYLRFMSPFYSAWSDTMRKWMRIVGYNPVAGVMLPKALTAFNSVFTVVDENGNQIHRNGDITNANGEVVGHNSDPTAGYIVVPVPEWLSDKWNGDGDVYISKGSLNVTFQGEPFWAPSMGPLAAIPANEIILRMFPQEADSWWSKYLLPFGTTSTEPLDQAQPMWIKNLATLRDAVFNPENSTDPRLTQTWAELYAAKVNQIRRGEIPPMTQSELMDTVSNEARNTWIMRFFSNWFGFSAQPKSRLEFYRKEWQRYRREYGYQDAEARFYQDYPDYYEAMISLSQNESGIAATDESWGNTDKYVDSIRRNPEYGWMYVGAANLDPGFSQGVYTAQQRLGLRGQKRPADALQDVQVNNGWRKYSQMQDAINAQIALRVEAGGKESILAEANFDLKQFRDRALAALKQENPAWAEAYAQGSTGTSLTEFFNAAVSAVTDHEELANRSDFVVLQEYMDARDQMRAFLDSIGAATVESPQAPAGLAEFWDAYKRSLVARDLGFEQMYNRAGLEQDIVSRS